MSVIVSARRFNVAMMFSALLLSSSAIPATGQSVEKLSTEDSAEVMRQFDSYAVTQILGTGTDHAAATLHVSQAVREKAHALATCIADVHGGAAAHELRQIYGPEIYDKCSRGADVKLAAMFGDKAAPATLAASVSLYHIANSGKGSDAVAFLKKWGVSKSLAQPIASAVVKTLKRPVSKTVLVAVIGASGTVSVWEITSEDHHVSR
jgi:hypothetical protein